MNKERNSSLYNSRDLLKIENSSLDGWVLFLHHPPCTVPPHQEDSSPTKHASWKEQQESDSIYKGVSRELQDNREDKIRTS